MNKIRPILLLEINEVPWRIIDRFAPEFPNLALFFSRGKNFTTFTVDEGELSPWITWPTMHRGISSKKHNIKFLGQDPSTYQGTPLWDEFLTRGKSVGICGSLQSWPAKDPGPKGFFIPDTFATTAECIPNWVSPFQELNLRMVKESGRVISTKIPLNKTLLELLKVIPKLGIRVSTLALIAKQLIQERLDESFIARRPTFQSILIWDIFKKLYNPYDPPAISTFFTNHVASVMHRYWQDTFPEDFQNRKADNRHAETMKFSIQILDNILKEALELQSKNPDIILVAASSMGQAAKVWDNFAGYSSLLKDPKALIKVLIPEISHQELIKIRPLLAMAPQTCLQFSQTSTLKILANRLADCKTSSGAPLFSCSSEEDRLSISLYTPNIKDLTAPGFTFQRSETLTEISWEQAGISIEKVSSASAYHVPEGIFSVVDGKSGPDNSRKLISADLVKNHILQLSGLLNEC